MAQVPEPSGIGVIVDVVAAGICGSDLHLVETGLIGDTTLGHEIAGLTPDGTPVAIEPIGSCGHCADCEAGDDGLCVDATAKLIGIGVDGGMADRVLVPEHLLVPLPVGLDVESACLVEPMAVAIRAILRAGIGADDRVIVIGGGSIGLCAAAAAAARGATVEVVARHDHQLAAAERIGAAPATDEPADAVIEAAGTTTALAEAIDRCRPGGIVGIPATYWDEVQLPGLAMGMKEVSLVPSIMYGRTDGIERDVTVAARLLAGDPEIGRALITHRYPLDGANEAFDVAADRSTGSIKVLLEPGS